MLVAAWSEKQTPGHSQCQESIDAQDGGCFRQSAMQEWPSRRNLTDLLMETELCSSAACVAAKANELVVFHLVAAAGWLRLCEP